jgi:hypothetical protein
MAGLRPSLTILIPDQQSGGVPGWADKFKVETVEGDEPARSWFYDLLSTSWLLRQVGRRLWTPLSDRLDDLARRRSRVELRLPPTTSGPAEDPFPRSSWRGPERWSLATSLFGVSGYF